MDKNDQLKLQAYLDGELPEAEASEVAKDFQAEGLVVRPDWARQNEDLLTRLLRATIQAERWVATPANKQAAMVARRPAREAPAARRTQRRAS